MSGEERMWFYMDSTGQEFGPYPSTTMKGWFEQGFFPMAGELQVRLSDMPPDQHHYIKDLFPEPIMERAFVGEPNLPGPRGGGGGRGRGGRSGGGGGGAPPPIPDPLAGANPYDPMGMLGMPGMMPGMPGMNPFGRGMGMPMMPGMPGMGMGMPMMGPGAATGRFTGKIKSFNVQKGFGFIECPEAHQIYGRDVFLHKAQIGAFSIGSNVSFAVEMNKQNMPQARDILESSDMLAGFAGGLMGFGGGGGVTGKGYNQKGGGKGKAKAGAKGKAKPKRVAEPKSVPAGGGIKQTPEQIEAALEGS